MVQQPDVEKEREDKGDVENDDIDEDELQDIKNSNVEYKQRYRGVDVVSSTSIDIKVEDDEKNELKDQIVELEKLFSYQAAMMERKTALIARLTNALERAEKMIEQQKKLIEFNISISSLHKKYLPDNKITIQKMFQNLETSWRNENRHKHYFQPHINSKK